MAQKLRLTAALALIFTLVGCASVFNDDRQTVSVRAMCGNRSVPAACVAENSRGRWTFQAPREIVVPKDMYALRVTCKSVLVEAHTVHAQASLQGAMAGNLVLGPGGRGLRHRVGPRSGLSCEHRRELPVVQRLLKLECR